MGGLVSFLCSPNAAHQNDRIFKYREVLVQARSRKPPSPPPEKGRTSKLGRIIGTDLQTVRLAIGAWEKGASRVSDCEAIGGSGGWKRIAQGWAGEKDD